MNKNDTDTNQGTFEEAIYECPYDTTPVVIEQFVNGEIYNGNQNYLIEEDKTELHDEVREI